MSAMEEDVEFWGQVLDRVRMQEEAVEEFFEMMRKKEMIDEEIRNMEKEGGVR